VKKIKDATDVIREIMQSPDQGIPFELLQKSAAVAIFPGVIKAGFVLGAEYGQGVILHHDVKTGRWSAPAFFAIAAGSVGWQIGAQSTDLILLIRNDRGLKAILKNEFKLGADLSVAAGPVGRKAQAGTDITFETEVWSYSRSRGLFAGISLEGARVYSQEDSNAAYYGKNISAREILLGADIKKPESATRLIHTMEDFSISYQE
jgi:lipid-binding SYLF domain-containing protein